MREHISLAGRNPKDILGASHGILTTGTPMNLTVEQVISLTPDDSSAAAGRKLASLKNWKSVGRDEAALWGECQGSALYQVRVDLGEFAYGCSCPSRKLPCKHVLGLLLLAAGAPDNVKPADAPEWVTDWLAKRSARAKQREEKKDRSGKPADPAAQARRAEERQQRVADGLDRLDLWLADLIRNGLAGLELQPPSYWEDQAKRLVDAQAPGLASRLRSLGEIPGSGVDWPVRLLLRLGRMALLTHAYRRLDQLAPPLQQDVRQLIGWTIGQEEVTASVADRWLILGQRVEDEDRLRLQKSWLRGESTGQSALILQFSAGGQPFPETIVPGVRLEADVVFWPSAFPQRGRFAVRRGEAVPITGRLAGVETIEAFLAGTSAALAKQPWLERFLCVMNEVTPTPRNGRPWQVRDRRGHALPLVRGEHWKLLALSGGHPVDLAAEWDGDALAPLGVMSEERYHLLGNELAV